MFLVTARQTSGWQVELACSVCRHAMTLEEAWFAFPADPLKVEGT